MAMSIAESPSSGMGVLDNCNLAVEAAGEG